MRLTEDMIGGGIVVRPFSRGEKRLGVGDKLTREDVLAIPSANRNSLIQNGNLSVYPPAAGSVQQPVGTLMVYSRGFGKFDVIRGTVLNEGPLSKDEAEALVASLQPPAQPAEEPAAATEPASASEEPAVA